MTSQAIEVVFSVVDGRQEARSEVAEDKVFFYADGPVKVPGPWRRGRPKKESETSQFAPNYEEVVGCFGAHAAVASRTSAKEPAITSPFPFINYSVAALGTDTASRAKIRKHARLHTNRRRVHDVEETTDHTGTSSKALSKALARPASMPESASNLAQIAGVDPFNTACIRLEPYMHDLLVYCQFRLIKAPSTKREVLTFPVPLVCSTVWRTIYSVESLGGWNPIRDYWLPMAFQAPEPALLHSFIACANTYVSGHIEPRKVPRGLRHLGAAISIINERLLAPPATISKATFAVIAGIALLEVRYILNYVFIL
jgi:hypothetical protein